VAASAPTAPRVLAQLKRSINGTHHHVSPEHLHRYLAEFDFRYSTCKMPTAHGYSKWSPYGGAAAQLQATH